MPKRTIFVDSRKRDTFQYPTPGEYVADLYDVAKNVEVVELVMAVYPQAGPDLVVNLDISELNENILTNCEGIGASFTQLPITKAVNEYTGGELRCIRRFRVPMEKLSKLSILWTDTEGAVYPMGEHFLRFEIETSERSSAVDTGYVEGISGGSHAFFGLGQVYTPTELYNAYMTKRRCMISEKMSAGEIGRADQLYKDLLRKC